jgi:hypothetical protein
LHKSAISMTMPPMRTLFITLALVGFVGCGDDGKTTPIDAPVVTPPIDAAPVLPALDCPTYCTQVMANCVGTNAQYVDQAHCIGSCAAFTVGTSKVTDTAGDTLGCRIYHSGAPAKADPVTHCSHVGPAGDKLTAAPPAVCNGGDLCTNFCALTIKTCGTAANPLTVGGVAIPPPYADMATCTAACAGFDKTHLYATNAAGNSLACRLNHWTNAASNAAATPPNGNGVKTHCGHIVATPVANDPCSAAIPTP